MRRNEVVVTTQSDILHKSLAQLLPKGSNYALLDFPHYSNVGDSALWLGGLRILSKIAGRPPGYVSMIERFNCDELLELVPEGPIFLSGGGNFGDIWPFFQIFREMILEKFNDRLVIQLPQSISYRDPINIARTTTIISNHPNFHLLVRDKPSFDFAKKNFDCVTELLPDMAFGLGILDRPIQSSHDIFMLLREDSERAQYDRTPLFSLEDAISADWINEPIKFAQRTKMRAGFHSLLTGSVRGNEKRLVYYKLLASGRINRGLNLLSSGNRVITDRLHAHILSTLLDIPHVVLDNNYGKIFNYIEAWTSSYAGVSMAKDANEALDKIKYLPHC